MTPLVSVIVPVHNCRDTVEEALESALIQTLPPERVEVIAIDDGSSDGSAELLDELARAHDRLTVLHQPNSGGAGAPRNRGLERASGEFVFFLDADDRLGPEALARMTAMAERNGTDIVLGKQVGTGGRRVPRVFERTIERTHVLDPDCDLFPRMSMAALQLFRRSLIDREELRFTEGILSHEDQLFTARAYLKASGVSVLADHDCYYWAARADGTSSTQVGGAASADVHAIAGQAMTMIAELTDPGELRERLHHRYLLLEVFGRLEQVYLDAPADEQKIMLRGCRELLDTWSTPGLLSRYDPLRRVVAHCLTHDLVGELEELLRFNRSRVRPSILLEDGRAFARYPLFRDGVTGVPDGCFETSPELKPAVDRFEWQQSGLVVGGTVVIPGVDEGTPGVHLVAENDEGARHRIACATIHGEAGGAGRVTPFTATFHSRCASWPDGLWTLSVEATLEGHTLTAPLTRARDLTVPHAVLVEADGGGLRLVRPVTVPRGGRKALALEVGSTLKATDLRNVEVTWGTRGRLRVTVEPPPVLPSCPARGMNLLLERRGDDDTVVRVPLVPDPRRPEHRLAEVPLAGARRGRWRASVQIDGVASPVKVRVLGGEGLAPVTASVIPPRRVLVQLNPVTVLVTMPLATRLRRALQPVAARSRAAETAPNVKEPRNVKEGGA